MNYKTLFKALFPDKTVLEGYLDQQRNRFEYDMIGEEMPILVQYFPDYIRDNIAMIKIIAQRCKYGNIHKIERYIKFTGAVIIQVSLLSLLQHSLKWNSYEQILLWRIINAHSLSDFTTKENLVYSLCYSINTFTNFEDCIEFLDGVFVLLKNWFKQQKELNAEELGYLFSLKLPLAHYIYQVMEEINVRNSLEKVIAHLLSKQETSKLTNAFECMRVFMEMDEKGGGRVMEGVKEDKSFKAYLKGVLPSVDSYLSGKTKRTLNKLIKT